MTTGWHTVADIECSSCQQIVGWKYELAYEKSQKYKEGKSILERSKIVPVQLGECNKYSNLLQLSDTEDF